MQTWKHDQFLAAAIEFRDRWRDAASNLNVQPRGFCDIARMTDGEFELPTELEPESMNSEARQLSIVSRMHARFTNCPATKGLRSPYEKLIDIIEHGGYFIKEHCYIDIRDAESQVVGGFDLSITRSDAE